ncbi:MAG: hypothetical protein ACODAJ_13100 [Planctomycetota bacterium]
MRRRRSVLVLAIGAALVQAWSPGLAGEVRKYRGNAYDLQTDKFVYSENHAEHYEGGKHVYSIVTYRDPDEKTMCRKVIVFRKSRTAPDFRLDDRRSGYVEGALAQGDRTKLLTREDAESPMRTKLVDVPEPAVIDGGFDYFIREHWDELVDQGKTVRFHFVVAHKLDHVRFTVAKTGEKVVEGVRCAEFKLAVAGFFAGLFVDPIYVAYDLDRHRLMEYRGTSNIGGPNDRNYRARIVFTYPWLKDAQKP